MTTQITIGILQAVGILILAYGLIKLFAFLMTEAVLSVKEEIDTLGFWGAMWAEKKVDESKWWNRKVF